MERKLMTLYIFCLSLTSAFALTSTLTIPVIISFTCVVVFFIKASLDKTTSLTIEPEDLVLFLFLFSVYFGFSINYDRFKSNKPINHIFAYSYVVIITYFFVKNIIYNLYKKYGASFLNAIYLTLSYALLFTCIFGIIEFSLKNFLNINIDNFIPRPVATEYEPTVLGFVVRLRSFVEESGHLALYIEIFAPIALYYIKEKGLLYYSLLLVVATCFILTFSTAGWLIATATYLVLVLSKADFNLSNKTIKVSLKSVFIYTALTCLVLTIFLVNYELISFISTVIDTTILGKINQSGSAEDRTARFYEGFNAFLSSPPINQLFGNGPAVYDTLQFSRGGTILLYLTIILESGLLGLSLFLLFFMLLTFKALKIKDAKLRFALLFALISSFLHFFIISNYWYPWFWLLAILIQLNYKIDYATTKNRLGHILSS